MPSGATEYSSVSPPATRLDWKTICCFGVFAAWAAAGTATATAATARALRTSAERCMWDVLLNELDRWSNAPERAASAFPGIEAPPRCDPAFAVGAVVGHLGLVPLHHRLDGPEDAPLLVLAPSLGTTLDLWEPQLAALTARFRVLRIDHRGHGESPLPPQGATVELLARDIEALLDSLEAPSASLCGLSLGGAVCLQLAASAPQRVDRLVLACTSTRFGEPAAWQERARLVRAEGVGAVADAVVARWFTPGFQERRPDVVAAHTAMLRATPPEGYARCCEAVGRWDGRDRLSAVRASTTVIAGRHDLAAPPAWGEAIAAGIPGARFELLDAAHIASVEQPDAFAALLLETLDGLEDAA